jgi:hypothetical protein
MPKKAYPSVTILSALLLLLLKPQILSASQRELGLRLGSGYLWAPHDNADLDGQRLYRQNLPFFAEISYGYILRAVVGLNHVFSQEREHTEVESGGEEVQFTPKLRQYILHLGAEVNRQVAPRVKVRGGLGLGVFWRAYNPGWKDKSFWDKTRVGGIGQAGIDIRLGRKAWVEIGVRSYASGLRRGGRWVRGEFNRMRRMDVLSFTVMYHP